MEISEELREQIISKISKLLSNIDETASLENWETDVHIKMGDSLIVASCEADVYVTERHCTTSTDRGLYEWDEIASREAEVYDLEIEDDYGDPVSLSADESDKMIKEIERRVSWRTW